MPATALHLVPGDGAVGAALVAHPRRSPASPSPARPRSARAINRALAAKDGPIVPLIAETGGINAMIVDSTALPEQVADDVVTSAFRSAGQRCSALRLLCVQEDVADRMLEMIAGAARELALGDPARPRDRRRPGDRRRGQAAARCAYRADDARGARASRRRQRASRALRRAACLRARQRSSELTEEVFGPILHVVRLAPSELDDVLDAINAHRLRPDARHPHRIDDTAERDRGARCRSATSTSTAT